MTDKLLMMKKVCHVTSPHSRYDERIFLKECTSLVNAGYQVILLCTDNKPNEIKNGVQITSVNIKSKGKIHRILKAPRILLKIALQIDADIYHFHDPELLPMGLALKKRGKKVIYDSHEDVPRQILDKTWIPKPLRKTLAIVYKSYEKYVCRRLDIIITVTPHILQRLIEYNANAIMVTNYPRIEEQSVMPNNKIEKKVCFAGGISEQWLHENIIQSLTFTTDVNYTLAGLANENYLNKLKKLQKWESVNYLGYLNRSQVFELYNTSIAGMALNDYVGNVGFKMGSLGNTKLFEYMMAGLPVICTDFVLWKEIVDKNRCGICVNPHDVHAISKAITFLIDNPEIARQMGENGHKAILETYNWETQEKILLDLYERL